MADPLASYHIDTHTYDKASRYTPGHGYGHLVARNPDRYVAPRPDPPTSIIIHTTNNRRKNTSFASEAAFLCDTPDVSSHYLVGKSPQAGIVRFLDDAIEAWHAGVARLGYRNPDSIGIENHVSVGEYFTPWQIDALTWLVQGLMARWGIPCDHVQTHRAVALPSGRKTDPEGWSDRDFYAWTRLLVPVPFNLHAMPPSDATPEPVLPPLPATPAAARTYRVILNKSWVRALPSTSKGTFIKALGLNSRVAGWLVPGEPVTSKAGVTSDRWLRLADDSGYIWAGQVREVA